MKKIGLVGWRGMVGSVLIDRMKEEHDFDYLYAVFLSTSQAGKKAPVIVQDQQDLVLQNAWDIEILNELDIIVTCQGSSYSKVMYSKLRNSGWNGYWIDSASYLRMHKDSVIILDPVNQTVIEKGINDGIKTFVGGNCTVSLMLMALGGLFKQNLVEWVFASTYQAASGYGAKAMIEVLTQMGQVYNTISNFLKDTDLNILEIDRIITTFSKSNSILVDCFKVPLVGNLIPWIGSEDVFKLGETQEEWKGQAETNKILGFSTISIPIDSVCVRISSLRCHSQVLVVKLKRDMCLTDIEDLIKFHNVWVRFVVNSYKESLVQLTPLSVSGTLEIAVGRLRKMNIGRNFISVFTVGDQLLWGASEPLRRMLRQLL